MVSTWWPISKFPFLVYLSYSGARVICKHTNICGMQAELVVTCGNTWPKKVWRHEPTGSRLSFFANPSSGSDPATFSCFSRLHPNTPSHAGRPRASLPLSAFLPQPPPPRSPFSSPHTGRPAPQALGKCAALGGVFSNF